MRTKGTPLSQINPATMKGPGDFSPPEHSDGPECIECGAEMTDVGDYTHECDECGHTECDEPDFEAMAEARYGGRAEAVEWGGMEGGW
jgi:hypothetical protein